MDRMDRLIRQKLGIGCGRNHDQRTKGNSTFMMSRAPSRPGTSHQHRQTQFQPAVCSSAPSSPPSIAVSASVDDHPLALPHRHPPLSGSPCPAIRSWPAPPSNPRAELKPTAIATPLAPSSSSRSSATVIASATPSTFLHHPLLQHRPTPSPSLQMSSVAASVSQEPSPIHLAADHHLPPSEEPNIPLLSVFRAVNANSTSPGGGNSPRGHWGRETELRQKIQALEEVVAEYERQKLNVLGTFTDFRERVAERERRLEAEYSHKIIDLSEEVLGAKRDFEERMKSFQILQEQFEREKEQALEQLRQDHQREIRALEQRFCQSQLLDLEHKYMIEIQRLEEERKGLRAERERLGEDFECKLRRAESLFETELTAAKMLYTRELQALREHEEALKDELEARQEEFHDRLLELQHQNRQAKDELIHCRDEVAQLERALGQKTAEIQRIARELSFARRQTEEAVRNLGQVQLEADGRGRMVREQREELERKAERLREAEQTRERLEGTVRELKMEVQGLRNRVDLLEVERDGLRAQGESQTQLHDSQVTALEAMLNSVTEEKEGCAERCKQLLDRERAEAEERELALRREFTEKLGELEEQYNGLREHVEQGAMGSMGEEEQSGAENEKLWEEIESLRAERAELEAKAKTDKSADLIKLAQAIQSVERRMIGGEDEAQEEEEQWEREPMELEELLQKLAELEKSVEMIVQEKEQTKAKLEMLGEGGGEIEGWKRRVEELESQLEERKAEMEKMEWRSQEDREKWERMRQAETGREVREMGDEQSREAELEERLRIMEQKLEQEQLRAEEEIRRMEHEHGLALENKLNALNREHERTVELMQQREQKMANELEQFRREKERKRERKEGETQTEEEEGEGEEEKGKEMELEEELQRAQRREQEKEELIRELREELEDLKGKAKAKECRSQSIASAGEHLAMCQKATAGGEGRAEERKECRRHDHPRALASRLDATLPQDLPLPPSSSSSSQRSLLSPIGAPPQRVSPTRQMSSGGKNGNGGGERRPAWKF